MKRQLAALSDAMLVQEYRNGNSPALEALVDRYKTDLTRYIAKIAGTSVAADALQETWVIVITAILNGSYEEKDNFKKYIKTIAYKQAVQAWRREHRFMHEQLPEAADEAMNEYERLAEAESQSTFYRLYHRHIKALTPDEAELIKMRFEQNMNNKQISMLRNIAVKSVKEMVSRALAKLRFLMQPHKGIL